MLSPDKPVITDPVLRASARPEFPGEYRRAVRRVNLAHFDTIWTHPLPPLSDYVNHLARMHVIATLAKNRSLQPSTRSTGR